jgi:hypothetical protein
MQANHCEQIRVVLGNFRKDRNRPFFESAYNERLYTNLDGTPSRIGESSFLQVLKNKLLRTLWMPSRKIYPQRWYVTDG